MFAGRVVVGWRRAGGERRQQLKWLLTVAAFAARPQDAVGLDGLRADLLGTVHQTLEPAHVSVWISAAAPQPGRWG